ncbi:MAG: 3-hydroxyacyl-CoA dehydrogenase NAD-binding domain-containing protein [Myxococcales bacterium]|nr:3-hydroxyacyl-CoA dehydrogenase NAD-binding domain-containing protein [Myxococcales bacterium]
MADVVRYEKQDGVFLIIVDNPPVNALAQAVRQGIKQGVEQANADPEVKAIVVTCEGRTFIAGADIKEFGKPHQPPPLPEVIAALEQTDKPTVAALFGTALGGGLEVALGCHFRVAKADAKLGLPEVKLGILPGAGGTQRLPRVIGVEASLDMIVGGDPIGAKQALSAGLVDELVEGDVRAGAVAYAKRVVAEQRPLRKLSEASVPGNTDAVVFDAYADKIRKKKRGFEAPFACIDAVRAAVELPYAQGLAKEREIFQGLVSSTQSGAQRHVFFAEREVAKIPDVPKSTETLPVKKVAVLGAGTMGAGIAMCFASAGMGVKLLDREQGFVDKGLATIEKNYASSVKRGKLSEADKDACVARITGTTSYDDLADVDLVVEAVFEEMGIKKEVFAKLDQVCSPKAILATNTSTLDVNEIASATSRPEMVIGLHFFSPAHLMKLLEIVRGDKTSKSVIATSMKLAKQLSKIGVLVGVCHGFVGNRILYPYRREASFLVEEGATPQQVDRVITDFGLPMGPFAMGDLAGLDVGWRVRQAQGKPTDERYSGTLADRLCEMGRFGQKTGRGYYIYEEGSRVPKPDPEVADMIEAISKELGIERREISDEEILERCIYPMINEGAKILDEGIALRASDIDVVWINGYGFPIYRGGPMFYGETVGLDQVYAKVCEFRDQQGKQWEPSPLLARLAKPGAKFDQG